jgi:hypothetical protein
MNYTMKDFDIYDTGLLGGGNSKIGTGKAWVPKGLIIEKFEYNI